ncbi:hypothetical protein GCM10009740_02390 [Terrabacter terrae]|uniref:ABC3 transporter permease C-terminal domain-containing protein n=1 Tax=Terrabacter terrae TaxID=318434 RepID=A0ABN2TRP5_9MICO
MEVGVLVIRRIARDWRRTAATGLSVLLAVTAFVVLTGSAEQARLEVTSTVDANYRSSYDVLVRPKGSQTTIEASTGRVRPNYLSGLYGGITTAQANAVARIPGVEVSAPIAMVGQVFQTVDVPIDVTDLVGDSGSALLRFSTTEESMRGLAKTAGSDGYLYVSNGIDLDLSGEENPVVQLLPSGKTVPVCRDAAQRPDSPFTTDARWTPQCWDRSNGSNGTRWPYQEGHFVIRVRMSFPVTVAAIDPAAEAALTGLDRAMVTGSYLTQQDTVGSSDPGGIPVPAIVSSRTLVDQTDRVRVDRLSPDAVRALQRGLTRQQARALVTSSSPVDSRTFTLTAQQGHDAWLQGQRGGLPGGSLLPGRWMAPSSVTYRQRPDGVLMPDPVKNDASIWTDTYYLNIPFAPVPMAAADTGYRQITAATRNSRSTDPLPLLVAKGTFDPNKIRSFSELSKLPLETYQSPTVGAANDATRAALKGRDLAPDANPAGYVQSPPFVLTTLKALPALTSRAFTWPTDSKTPSAPISAVRVRVAGVTGADPASRERIRLAAERITQATGLAVDITVGSSPRPTPVALPATAHGAPALMVSENWVQKGVAATVTSAVDRKSLALFLLILLTTALAVSISANASVRARRIELGVLSCLGWRPGLITRHVIGELLTVGAAAGLAGAVLSIPAGRAFGASVPLSRATLAVPAAVLLTLIAGLIPARRAARATPADAIRPAVTARTPIRVPLRGPATMGLGYLLRTPARAMTGAVALAMGVAALTALTGISVAFQGSVVGTLLGDAVSVQVRGPDIVAAVVMTVIGLGCLLDILYLDLREQAPQYAALQASGWRDNTLTRLITTQAAIIGAIGAFLGAGLGLAAVALLTGITGQVLLVAAGIALAGLAATSLLALLPARRLRHLPTAELLSRE